MDGEYCFEQLCKSIWSSDPDMVVAARCSLTDDNWYYIATSSGHGCFSLNRRDVIDYCRKLGGSIILIEQRGADKRFVVPDITKIHYDEELDY